ncbi:unnamed protein product [Didymodactylos carnosus]|nr:unnamed protein product [Didymodactylos carnosus]CAF3742262.1 unnamed protein product [Didymodactylos carnosus]
MNSTLVKLPESLHNNQTLFMSTKERAKIRNEELLRTIDKLSNEVDTFLKHEDGGRFTTLKTNYWNMVQKVLPIWQQELDEYETQKKEGELLNNKQQ